MPVPTDRYTTSSNPAAAPSRASATAAAWTSKSNDAGRPVPRCSRAGTFTPDHAGTDAPTIAP